MKLYSILKLIIVLSYLICAVLFFNFITQKVVVEMGGHSYFYVIAGLSGIAIFLVIIFSLYGDEAISKGVEY